MQSRAILRCLFPILATVPVLAQVQTQTDTVVVPASTQVVATTLTYYSSAPTVTVTPTFPPSPQYTSTTDFIDSILNSTNFYRYEHGAQFLAWNASLVSYATNWAQQCMWEHSHGAPGENLARGYPDVTSAVDAWGDERSLYNFNTPTGYSEATGHFTQLVWKATQTVGCSAIDCNGRNGIAGFLLVCEYWPPGNIVGQGNQVNSWFETNVQSQINDGQGFNIASATAGASGVGTSWATSAGPSATSLSGAVAPHSPASGLEAALVGGLVALLGAFDL